ncbi:hypothetical protein CVD28_03850 [Bacillus sp. M6-12]|uniref:class I SAM-dependent methyltransferase n=1 Tax=Bacillus sp. M6-12 TaxID=2054166 RepID=UPI000C7930F5|nr:methyltransferase domain-containing protein [Bacillus sp. M6-12]PLS19561.1 hypothetical protein CVD28_03850 [Bacillus sp. M6-12]
MKIQPENTAITTGVSKSAKELERQSNKEDRILDYGSGKFRNSKYLKEKGLHVSVLDTDFQIQKATEEDKESFEDIFTLETYEPHSDYNSVLCSFVLNVIPEEEKRKEALENIHQSLKENGKLFLEVRGKNGILKNKYKEPYNDGYVIGKNEIKTFQKPYEKEELENLLKDKFEIEKIQTLSDSVFAIAKKK